MQKLEHPAVQFRPGWAANRSAKLKHLNVRVEAMDMRPSRSLRFRFDWLHFARACVLALGLATCAPQLAAGQAYAANAAPPVVTHPNAILWTDPLNIKERNLYYGPGGEKGMPSGPFTFVKEDKGGTNPKFDIRDNDGKKWKAKLGVEARPETTATRLLWAVGFVTNENYFVPDLKVDDMLRLKRGQKPVGKHGEMQAVRLQRPPAEKKIGDWNWKNNPFKGSREFNGLRVMMALLSNWDLKNDNNAIYGGKDEADPKLYEVSDLGASFGTTGDSYTAKRSKNNLKAYRHSKFISKVTPSYVDFNFPTHPPFMFAFNLPFFISQMRLHWIGQHIPRADAKWMASLLSQLTPQQIEDAFRAGGYTPEQVQAYAAAVESRIAQLQRL